jgi:hypothetical protein
MTKTYRYRFPINVTLWRWGMTIYWQPPIVKLPTEDISSFFHMFDEEP